MEPEHLAILTSLFMDIRFARKERYSPRAAGSILAYLRGLSSGQPMLETTLSDAAHAMGRDPRTVRAYIDRFAELGLVDVVKQDRQGITLRVRAVGDNGALADLADAAIEAWSLAGRPGLPLLPRTLFWRTRNDDDLD